MTLHLWDAIERGCGDGDVEMPAFARAGVPGVLRAVVANLQQGRVEGRLQGLAQLLDARVQVGSFGPFSFDSYPRSSPNGMNALNRTIAGRKNQVLS